MLVSKCTITPYKLSWHYSMKDKCDLIIWNYKITFQASDFKRNHFLKLFDNDYLSIEPVYTKNGAWLKSIRHSNSLCVRTIRVITNHAPIKKLIQTSFSLYLHNQ